MAESSCAETTRETVTDAIGPDDALIESVLLDLVQQRGLNATICPSEVVRKLAPHAWRPLMSAVQSTASRLARQGAIDITQAGQRVSADGPWRGPIRLRLARPVDAAKPEES